MSAEVEARGDEDLLEAWRTGDRDAGDALIARHIASLFRFFEHKIGQDAEDLTQRTLLDCLESRAAVRPGHLRAYLFGVARHRLIDHLRRKLRAGDAVPLEAISIADAGSSVGRKLARDQEQRRLHDALRSLPLDQQLALELAYWEGMTGPEIAAVLGVEPGTVRSRLSRARDALRQRLTELGARPDEVEASVSQFSEP